MDKVHERMLKQHDRVLYVLHQISFPGVMLEEVKFPFHDGSARSVEDVDGLVTRALLARHDNQVLLENMSLDELTAKEGELMEQYPSIPHCISRVSIRLHLEAKPSFKCAVYSLSLKES